MKETMKVGVAPQCAKCAANENGTARTVRQTLDVNERISCESARYARKTLIQEDRKRARKDSTKVGTLGSSCMRPLLPELPREVGEGSLQDLTL